MAIKRLDPKATFKLISELDSAVQGETPEELAALEASKTPTRYEQYLEDLDESKLILKAGETPERFIIRCLRNDENAELQGKHMELDSERKMWRAKNNAHYLFDIFERACIGIENADGTVSKISHNELGFAVALSVAGSISLFTTAGKHLKKP